MFPSFSAATKLRPPARHDAILPGTSTWQALLTTGKLHHSNLAHFFFHNARNHMAETLTAGRERAYLGDFFDRIAFNVGAFGPEVVDRYTASYAAPGGMKAGFEVYRAFDQDVEDNTVLLKTAGKLKTPTLFVAGAESFLRTVAAAMLAEFAQDGRVATVPRSGHYPPEENPAGFVEVVLAFLRRP